MTKVLVAEDEEAMLEIFGDVIEGLGYAVRRARNGKEAFLLAQAEVPDLVVSDQMMPGQSGIELLRALRAEPSTAHVPFLLVSAARPNGLEEADYFLSKPFGLETFEAAVQRALQSRRPRQDVPAVETALTPEPSSGLKEEVLNWVAHEMKTPLAAARLNAQFLLRLLQQKSVDEAEKRGHAVVDQVDRLHRLVSAILDAARLSEGRVTPDLAKENLSLLVQQLADQWRTLHPGIQIHLTDAAGPVEMLIDAKMVTTILENLLSNAVKHAGLGNRVFLTIDRTPGAVLVEVRDEGPGIPAADLPRLFDRFYRGKTSGEGHGLGLYIAASLARLMGGALSVQSSLGSGSRFSLRLPFRT